MQFKLAWIFICCLMLSLPASAQEDLTEEFPTITALLETDISVRDRVLLAEELFGIDVPEPPSTSQPRLIGDQQTFTLIIGEAQASINVEATLLASGTHLYLYLDDQIDYISQDVLNIVVKAFDQRVYEQVRELWGSEATPGIDGDPVIYALVTDRLGPYTGAYFSSDNSQPREAVPSSNQHEMFVIGAGMIQDAAHNPSFFFGETVLAHEFQHMIRYATHAGGDGWLNEGLSEFTQFYLYGVELDLAGYFLSQTDVQLNTWGLDESSRYQNYAVSFTFLLYLYDRFGLEFIQDVSSSRTPRALQAISEVLAERDLPPLEEVFADWVLANGIRDDAEGTVWNYPSLGTRAGVATPTRRVNRYPFQFNDTVNQYAADYIQLRQLGDATAIQLSLEVPATVPLIDALEGQDGNFWYSNRRDQADMRMTIPLDLSDVTSATLNFRTWYHLEDFFDFAYVMVSTDDGQTWQPLSSEHMTDEDPYGVAYGTGYTSVSGSEFEPQWINETISLDEFAGQTIHIRFQLLTDDAVTAPGFAVDDIEIPELGLAFDGSATPEDWALSGWINTDNRLPQSVWVQIAQNTTTGWVVERELIQVLEGGPFTWDFNRLRDASQVLIAISPFAPVTTENMEYTINVELK